MAERTVQPPHGPFRGTVSVPGDKSLSHRSLLFAAMATGHSEVRGLGPGLDVTATLRAVEALGARFDGVRLVSRGVAGWRAPTAPIDCGNSGTTLRILTGCLAASGFTTMLLGDESLSRRPMQRVAEPLRRLGASIDLSEAGTAPVTVRGSELHAASVRVDVASAQVRSAFELAAIQADGESSIAGPAGFRDHTERMLEAFGLGARVSAEEFTVRPGEIPAGRYEVPGDPSSAAFLWASAAMTPGAIVTTPGISLNPGRLGFLQALEDMGASITAEVTGTFHGDVVGSVTVAGAELHAIEVGGDDVAAMIDELPLLAVVATTAEGITRVAGAAELRAKESDRIVSTVAMVRALGGGAEEVSDGFAVVGTGFLDAGIVASAGDHRIAMAAAVAATASRGAVTVSGSEAASVSWPRFFDALETLWSSR